MSAAQMRFTVSLLFLYSRTSVKRSWPPLIVNSESIQASCRKLLTARRRKRGPSCLLNVKPLHITVCIFLLLKSLCWPRSIFCGRVAKKPPKNPHRTEVNAPCARRSYPILAIGRKFCANCGGIFFLVKFCTAQPRGHSAFSAPPNWSVVFLQWVQKRTPRGDHKWPTFVATFILIERFCHLLSEVAERELPMTMKMLFVSLVSVDSNWMWTLAFFWSHDWILFLT